MSKRDIAFLMMTWAALIRLAITGDWITFVIVLAMMLLFATMVYDMDIL